MAFRKLTKVPKLRLVYFSIDKKIRKKESGEVFSNTGSERGAKVILRANGKLLDAMVIAAHGKILFVCCLLVLKLNCSRLLYITWAYLFFFFAEDENQLNQEERSLVEDPVNAHLFAEEDNIMDKRQQPRNADLTAKRARTTDNQDEVKLSIVCFL